LFLIAGIAKEPACSCAGTGTDGSSFEPATGLMTDDAAYSGTSQTTSGDATLGVGPNRTGAAGERKCGDGPDECE
jgi:hypothetical protein